MSGLVVKKNTSYCKREEVPCDAENYVHMDVPVLSSKRIFITGLNARGIFAETSKKKIETESKLGSRKLGAVS